MVNYTTAMQNSLNETIVKQGGVIADFRLLFYPRFRKPCEAATKDLSLISSGTTHYSTLQDLNSIEYCDG